MMSHRDEGRKRGSSRWVWGAGFPINSILILWSSKLLYNFSPRIFVSCFSHHQWHQWCFKTTKIHNFQRAFQSQYIQHTWLRPHPCPVLHQVLLLLVQQVRNMWCQSWLLPQVVMSNQIRYSDPVRAVITLKEKSKWENKKRPKKMLCPPNAQIFIHSHCHPDLRTENTARQRHPMYFPPCFRIFRSDSTPSWLEPWTCWRA